MRTWSYRPSPRPPSRHERLAAARDVAIIAVCFAILAFALLVLLGTAREDAPRHGREPAARVSVSL